MDNSAPVSKKDLKKILGAAVDGLHVRIDDLGHRMNQVESHMLTKNDIRLLFNS